MKNFLVILGFLAQPVVAASSVYVQDCTLIQKEKIEFQIRATWNTDIPDKAEIIFSPSTMFEDGQEFDVVYTSDNIVGVASNKESLILLKERENNPNLFEVSIGDRIGPLSFLGKYRTFEAFCNERHAI